MLVYRYFNVEVQGAVNIKLDISGKNLLGSAAMISVKNNTLSKNKSENL